MCAPQSYRLSDRKCLSGQSVPGRGLTPVAELDDGSENVVLDLPDDDNGELVGGKRAEQRLEVRREGAQYDLVRSDGLRLVAGAYVHVRTVLFGQ